MQNPVYRRWVQLVLGLLVMMTISSYQYLWTLFVRPFQDATSSSLAAVQVTFTLIVALQSFLSPLQGAISDRFKPKYSIAAGTALGGLGWVCAAHTTSLLGLYASVGLLCGVGTGMVYVSVVGLMVQWFPHRRGFAAGIVAAGYGMGAMFATFPITHAIAAEGFRNTLMKYGVIFGVIGVVLALGLRAPSKDEASDQMLLQRPEAAAQFQTTPGEMLRTPLFWLMFFMMTIMATGGTMVVSNFAIFAHEFGVANALVFGMAALPFALTLDRVTNGLTRPLFGWVSDHLGRELTMTVAFALEAVAILCLLIFRGHPYAFAILSGVVFFAWGEIFSLFPATLTDTFGTKHATTNYGFLYISFGVSGLLGGPVAALIHDAAGSWVPVFSIAIGLDVLSAVLAFFVLLPARRRWLANRRAIGGGTVAVASPTA